MSWSKKYFCKSDALNVGGNFFSNKSLIHIWKPEIVTRGSIFGISQMKWQFVAQFIKFLVKITQVCTAVCSWWKNIFFFAKCSRLCCKSSLKLPSKLA